jgi:hypothetical protein
MARASHILAAAALAGAAASARAAFGLPSMSSLWSKAGHDADAVHAWLRGMMDTERVSDGGETCRPCCAGYADGSYGANITLMVSADGHSGATIGSVFADASTEEYILWVGDYCPERSKAGAYVYRDDDDAVKAVVWYNKKCR